MQLLKLLQPIDIPLRKKQWNWQVRVYNYILRLFLPIYKRCAVSDTITIGKVKVVHTIRDYWYEQELQRFHIDTAQHLERMNVPFNSKRKFRHSSLFSWSESLLIFYNEKSYNIKRSDNYVIETGLEGQLKISGATDFISRSEFVAKLAKLQKISSSTDTIVTTVPNQGNGKPSRQRVSVKDSIPAEPTHTEAAETVKYRGFEENTVF